MEVEVLKIDKNVRSEFSLKTDEKKTLVKIEEGSEKKEL